ncbi:hypothetical protein LguiB_024095 [Lonicera macranthoides]
MWFAVHLAKAEVTAIFAFKAHMPGQYTQRFPICDCEDIALVPVNSFASCV